MNKQFRNATDLNASHSQLSTAMSMSIYFRAPTSVGKMTILVSVHDDESSYEE